jgi:hypothetical protein
MDACTGATAKASIRDRIDEIQGFVNDTIQRLSMLENKVGIGRDCSPKLESAAETPGPFSTLEKLNMLHSTTLEVRARLNDLDSEF